MKKLMFSTIIVLVLVLVFGGVSGQTTQPSIITQQIELCKVWLTEYAPLPTLTNTPTNTEEVKTSTSTLYPTITNTLTFIPTITKTNTPIIIKTFTPTTTRTFTPTIIKTNTATPTKTATLPSSVIFNVNFETGNFLYFNSQDAEIFGKGTNYKATVVTSPAIGNYSAALQIGSGTGSAMYLFTYREPQGVGIYEADYYIPSTVTPGSWWNVWQWKSNLAPYNVKPLITMNIIKVGGVLQGVITYNPSGIAGSTQTIYQSQPIVFPTNQWVHIKGEYKLSTTTTGYAVLYQNGVKILEKTGIITKPGGGLLMWSIQSYADSISPNPATIYIDNMRISQ